MDMIKRHTANFTVKNLLIFLHDTASNWDRTRSLKGQKQITRSSICTMKLKLANSVIGRGRQHKQTYSMFLYPALDWPNTKWWGQFIPSGHLTTAFLTSPSSLSWHWAQHDVLDKRLVSRSVAKVFQLTRLDTGIDISICTRDSTSTLVTCCVM